MQKLGLITIVLLCNSFLFSQSNDEVEQNQIELKTFRLIDSLKKENNYQEINRLMTLSKLFKIADSLFQHKNYSDAIQIFDKMIEISPKEPDYYIFRGECYGNNNDYQQAITNYEKSIEFGGNKIKISSEIGRCYFYMSNYKEALKKYDFCIKNDSIDDFCYMLRGQLKLKLDDLNGAYLDLTKASSINPKNEKAYQYLGDYYLLSKNYQSAEKYYLKSLELNPVLGNSYTSLAEIYSDYYKNQVSAIKYIDLAINIDSNNAELYFQKGLIYSKFNEFNNAIKNYNISINIADTNYYNHYNKALCYGFENKFDLAIESAFKALKINNKHSESYNLIGVCYAKKKSYKNACHYFGKAIELGNYTYKKQYELDCK